MALPSVYQQHFLQRKGFTLFLALILLGLGAIAVERATRGSSDFRGFHRIWAANSRTPTQPMRQTGSQPSDPDPYPPSSYVIFAPLGYLPLPIAAGAWYLLNLAASWGAWKGLESLGGVNLRGTRLGFLTFVSIFPFWIGNMVSGQNGPILICLVIWGYIAASRKKFWQAGTFLGLAILIKAIPILFLLPFFNRRDFRLIIAAGLFCSLWIGGVCSLYFGPQTNLLFQQRWLQMVIHGPDGKPPDPHHPKTLHSSPRYGNQASEAVLARLLMNISARGDSSGFHVNLADIKSSTWRSLRTLFVVIVLLGCGYRLCYRMDFLDPLDSLSVATLSLLLISPIVWTHYYLWMMIPCLQRLKRSSTTPPHTPDWLMWGWWGGEVGLASVWARAIGLQLWLVLLFWANALSSQDRNPPNTLHNGVS